MSNQDVTAREVDDLEKRQEQVEINVALKSVNNEIAEYEQKLKEIIDSDKNDPISIEGETTAGYFCHLIVEAKEVAEIILRYNYPVWSILGSDAPDEMWSELARKFGLGSVQGFDL